MIKSTKLRELVNLIKTKKDNYLNVKYFVFYVFKLQSKIWKNLFVLTFAVLLICFMENKNLQTHHRSPSFLCYIV